MAHTHQSQARALKRLPIDLETLPEIDMSNPNVDHELKSGPRRFNGKPPTGFGDLSPLSPYSAREEARKTQTPQEIAKHIAAMPTTLGAWLEVLGALESQMARFDSQDFGERFESAKGLILDAYLALEDSAPNEESERAQRSAASWKPNQARSL